MEAFDPGCLPDLLPVYYRRLFPFGPYGRWLRYGDVSKNYFQHREFSFTLRDDIYVRYQSFNTPQDLEKEIQKTCPYKIDIGAVYSHRPAQHNTIHMGAFQAQEKELVFDIDMTDYDDVRRCCSSAEICSKCWTLMTIAIRIIDRALVGEYMIALLQSSQRGDLPNLSFTHSYLAVTRALGIKVFLRQETIGGFCLHAGNNHKLSPDLCSPHIF
uniref:DNA primase AEP n=1 Tax=Salvator merianae TaxID=96440 RepID=A0A8D0DKZ9_SALMN